MFWCSRRDLDSVHTDPRSSSVVSKQYRVGTAWGSSIRPRVQVNPSSELNYMLSLRDFGCLFPCIVGVKDWKNPICSLTNSPLDGECGVLSRQAGPKQVVVVPLAKIQDWVLKCSQLPVLQKTLNYWLPHLNLRLSSEHYCFHRFLESEVLLIFNKKKTISRILKHR